MKGTDIQKFSKLMQRVDQNRHKVIERLWKQYRDGALGCGSPLPSKLHLQLIYSKWIIVRAKREEPDNKISAIQVRNLDYPNPVDINFMGYDQEARCLAFKGETKHLDAFLDFAEGVVNSERVEHVFKVASDVRVPEGGLEPGLEYDDFAARVEIVEYAMWLKDVPTEQDETKGEGDVYTIISVLEDGTHKVLPVNEEAPADEEFQPVEEETPVGEDIPELQLAEVVPKAGEDVPDLQPIEEETLADEDIPELELAVLEPPGDEDITGLQSGLLQGTDDTRMDEDPLEIPAFEDHSIPDYDRFKTLENELSLIPEPLADPEFLEDFSMQQQMDADAAMAAAIGAEMSTRYALRARNRSGEGATPSPSKPTPPRPTTEKASPKKSTRKKKGIAQRKKPQRR